MVELKAKPLPIILLGVLLLAAAYRVWDFRGSSINQSNSSNSSSDGGGGSENSANAKTEGPASSSNLLDFYGEAGMDGLKIAWSHGTNSKEKLETALKDSSIHMIEADVRMKDKEIVMAHGTSDLASSEVTLQDWLKNFKSVTNKGIKLDIKTSDAVRPAMTVLKECKSYLNLPVFVNADIIRGPNGEAPTVEATKFFETVENIFPDVTLSIGWTTGYKSVGENSGYSKAMIDEMLELCRGKTQPITFPVRASLLKGSLDELQRLLAKVQRSSLTIWHYPTDDVDLTVLAALRNNVSKDRVFYDLPSDIVKEFVAMTLGK